MHPRGHRGGCRLTGASPHAPPGAGWCAAAAQKPAAKKDDKNVKPAKKLPDIPGLDSALFKRAMAEQKANGIEMNGPKIHRLRTPHAVLLAAPGVCALVGRAQGTREELEACATGRCAKTQEAMCPGAAAPRGRWGVGVRCPTACESGCSAWSAWRRVRGRVTLRLALVYWQPEDR